MTQSGRSAPTVSKGNIITMRVWLDDRRPAPKGWIWVKTVEEAQQLLLEGPVIEMSLDHDLGTGPVCEECQGFKDDGYYNDPCEGEGGCACRCHQPLPSGYDFVKWMAENNRWPKKPPYVHSMNPVGRENMQATIKSYFK